MINNKNKSICLRCGKELSKLRSHAKNIYLCEAKYLNITYEEMISNYDQYYKEYEILYLKNVYKCKDCGKIYKYQSGLSRHKKYCNKTNNKSSKNINSQQNNSANFNATINGDINININNNVDNHVENHIGNNIVNNITLQNLGTEVNPDIKEFVKMIIKDLNENGGRSILYNFFKLLHIDTIENRNILVKSEKSPNIDIYCDNNWKTVLRKNVKDKIIDETKEKLEDSFNIASNKYKNNSIYSKLKKGHSCFKVDFDEYNKNLLFNEFIAIMLDNKDVLLDIKKASQKGNVINTEQNNMEELLSTENNIEDLPSIENNILNVNTQEYNNAISDEESISSEEMTISEWLNISKNYIN